jgi:hypothetical protein
MNAKTAYKYFEDNGGGLHLFVFRDGEVVDGITNLEYCQRGEWHEVKAELDEDAVEAVHSWDGHMRDNDIDAAEMYAEMRASDYGYDLVCDNGNLHIERMGAAARKYFDVTAE